jgi:hypothetical protein
VKERLNPYQIYWITAKVSPKEPKVDGILKKMKNLTTNSLPEHLFLITISFFITRYSKNAKHNVKETGSSLRPQVSSRHLLFDH